jgi:6-pyruvoyltetrahydropterin/6-carboxytetrahydropterin synthase
MYASTKQYGHELGLSSAFRQWRAHSHCRFIHGYALAVKFVFEADELDRHGWVVDFGSLKSLKGILEDNFDHKLLVAEDDPELETLKRLEARGLAQVRVLPAVGCEHFAEYIYGVAEVWLRDNGYAPRVRLASVKVCEHGANTAIYARENSWNG